MKRYSFAESIPEFQDLADEDKKAAFKYAYLKKFRHWQPYVWLIIPVIVGTWLSTIVGSNAVQSLIVGITVVSAMTLSDYMTKPIFKKYLLNYIQIKKDKSNQTFESIISRKTSKQAQQGASSDR
ncbi:hypothetical protein NT6N_03040 [Oceaniferula spumae]|uniref:Uncharacterized protein n=1 Tax=Oceaniferula spumae TaxID=2979115 RepID=A0AAT9FH14_9BACT